MFMNQVEIEIASSRNHACHNVRRGVNLLYRLMLSANEQSDGWAYWSAPSHACRKLQDLLKTAGNLWYDTHGTITDQQLKAAVAPIRSMVARQTKRQKQYGNTFTFDVDAALSDGAAAFVS
jgi:hypothetical protein